LAALPKAEIHLHLEGAIRLELLQRLAGRHGVSLPFGRPEEFYASCRFRSFDEFARLLLMGVHCLREPQDFFEVVLDIGATLADQHIYYAEVTWTPQFYVSRGYPLETILDAMNEARAQVKGQRGVNLRWVADMVRSKPALTWAVAQWASGARARAGGVVALGLGGPEAGHPASGFSMHFRHARSLGLPANPHAGEGMGSASIWETIASLRPKRLGHGVRASEDANLVAFLAHEALPLEICLTSNVKLGVVPSYVAHPVKRLIDAGCVVTLNTDDPVLFATSLTDEYVHAVERCGLTLADIRCAILNAVRCSYLSDAEKTSMVAAFQARFEDLTPPAEWR
jgi:adenosine deaminase